MLRLIRLGLFVIFLIGFISLVSDNADAYYTKPVTGCTYDGDLECGNYCYYGGSGAQECCLGNNVVPISQCSGGQQQQNNQQQQQTCIPNLVCNWNDRGYNGEECKDYVCNDGCSVVNTVRDTRTCSIAPTITPEPTNSVYLGSVGGVGDKECRKKGQECIEIQRKNNRGVFEKVNHYSCSSNIGSSGHYAICSGTGTAPVVQQPASGIVTSASVAAVDNRPRIIDFEVTSCNSCDSACGDRDSGVCYFGNLPFDAEIKRNFNIRILNLGFGNFGCNTGQQCYCYSQEDVPTDRVNIVSTGMCVRDEGTTSDTTSSTTTRGTSTSTVNNVEIGGECFNDNQCESGFCNEVSIECVDECYTRSVNNCQNDDKCIIKKAGLVRNPDNLYDTQRAYSGLGICRFYGFTTCIKTFDSDMEELEGYCEVGSAGNYAALCNNGNLEENVCINKVGDDKIINLMPLFLDQPKEVKIQALTSMKKIIEDYHINYPEYVEGWERLRNEIKPDEPSLAFARTTGFAIKINTALNGCPDFSPNNMVDLDDFFLFADNFGRPVTKDDEIYDLVKDEYNVIGLSDFFVFADYYGREVQCFTPTCNDNEANLPGEMVFGRGDNSYSCGGECGLCNYNKLNEIGVQALEINSKQGSCEDGVCTFKLKASGAYPGIDDLNLKFSRSNNIDKNYKLRFGGVVGEENSFNLAGFSVLDVTTFAVSELKTDSTIINTLQTGERSRIECGLQLNPGFCCPAGSTTSSDGSRCVLIESTSDYCADFNQDGKVDYIDYFYVADNFGISVGELGYDAKIDLDKDGRIGFGDFFIFADEFGKVPNCGDEVICIDSYDPVCGENGETYRNECYANKNGINVECEGECPCEDKNIISPTNEFITLYGSNSNVKTGDIVTIKEGDGILCGQYNVIEDGYYLISCYGDDPDTLEDEGANGGDVLTIYVNDVNTDKTVVWEDREARKVEL